MLNGHHLRRAVAYVLITSLFLFFAPSSASAASLTALSDTMSRLANGEASNHTIKYTSPAAGGVAAGETMTIAFPAGFTIGTVDYTDIDVSWGPSTGAENELTLAATPSGATWGAAFSSQTLTITSGSGTIDASSKIIVEIGTNATTGATGDQQITNNSSAATYTISIAGTFGDTGKIAIVVVDDDQVTVNAVVDPSLTFSLSATSTNFGTIPTGAVDTSDTNINLVIGSNSASGYTITVKDAGNGTDPGLWNSTASKLIGSASAAFGDTASLEGGTEGYGLQASTADGATIGSRFDGAGDEVGGLEVSGSLPTLASYASHQTASHTITVVHKAAVSTTTEAGAYVDTITYIATGNF